MEPGRLPLTGVKVIELCLARAGPTCVRHLSDWGADVIKIEAVNEGGEDITGRRDGFDYQNLHRNKRCIEINLKSPEGHAIFMRLVKTADVIVENMRSTVKHRLKVAWEDVHKVNPRLVYGSISGFGQTGPYANRPGVDQIAQGMSGLMSVTGAPGQGPMRVGIPIGDTASGTHLAMGIAMALFDRERTGEGRWVHTSLLESLIYMMDFQSARWLVDKKVPGQAGNEHPQGVPTGVYASSDGYINISATSTRLWHGLCDALGKPVWKTKAEWSTQAGRRGDRRGVNGAIAEIAKTKTTAHWVKAFGDAGVPCGPIYTVDQVFDDPQVKHIGIAAPVHHPRLGKMDLVASPLNFSGTTRALRCATPDPEQFTDDILTTVGYTKEEVAQLRTRKIVR
jgi:crotonobetainyl-CoA:carnitine CoA-transferase CaiB-like acyl-CoA transferase